MTPEPAEGMLVNLYERSLRLTPEQIGDALRAGRAPGDRGFDRFLPEDLQRLSSSYWTPLSVAVRAARWFADLDVGTVLDVGSGAGKFCVATALAGGCRVIGIEQRPRLVEAARALAELFGVEDRVSFIEGSLGEAPLPEADAYYLFNPFGENLYEADGWIAPDVELSDARYERDVSAAEAVLRDAPVGSFVVTYNGFGGRVPWYYREVRVDRELPSVLRMWQKTVGLSAR